MPQHAHGTMTTEQLDLLTVAGHLDLDGLEQLQQRLDDMPAGGRAVYAMNGIERNPAPHSILGLSWVVFRPGPRRPANQQTRRGVSDTITGAGAGAHRVHRHGGR